MDQLALLWLLSISMLIGSFLSGMAPLAFRMSDSKSRLLALLGSGILVGTALAIIIPEGINSLFASMIVPQKGGTDKHDKESVALDELASDAANASHTWTIGMSLVCGFVLMLLIDQFSLYQNEGEDVHNHSSHEYALASQDERDTPEYSTEVDNNWQGSEASPTPDAIKSESATDSNSHRVSIRPILEPTNGETSVVNIKSTFKRRHSVTRAAPATKVTPTLGLVIHASADGIALGAAASGSRRHVEMIIFLAIMLHKAPAAFSLVVFLIHRGLHHASIRRHLLAFSLSAPLAAIVTYYGLSQSGKEALRRNNATGIAMLFSAGTFLYVATVHVLPELVHNKLLSAKELIFVVGGAFLPILLAQAV